METALKKLLEYLSPDVKHTMWDYAVDNYRIVILCNLKKFDKKKLNYNTRLKLKTVLQNEISQFLGRWVVITYTDQDGLKEFVSFCKSYRMTPKKTKFKQIPFFLEEK